MCCQEFLVRQERVRRDSSNSITLTSCSARSWPQTAWLTSVFTALIGNKLALACKNSLREYPKGVDALFSQIETFQFFSALQRKVYMLTTLWSCVTTHSVCIQPCIAMQRDQRVWCVNSLSANTPIFINEDVRRCKTWYVSNHWTFIIAIHHGDPEMKESSMSQCDV